MNVIALKSYAQGNWVEASSSPVEISSAVTGKVVAAGDSSALDFAAMVEFAKVTGGKNLRQMTFQSRAAMLKGIAQYLQENRETLYELAYEAGATKRDNLIDIDGGISTLFVFASKGRKELPDTNVLVEGAIEPLSRDGSFSGQHVLTPLQGVAVHINAFNFPVWGMLEKLAPCLLAGVPAIVKPATSSSFVTEACVQLMVRSGLLPEGAVQLIIGSTGKLLDMLDGQDVVSFTGSAQTAQKLQDNENFAREGTRFIAERDSLNSAILGTDVDETSAEFGLFVDEIVKEMTAKAGQKCTAIRRAFVPAKMKVAVVEALSIKLGKVRLGHPTSDEKVMGPLVSVAQRNDVLEKVEQLTAQSGVSLAYKGELRGEGIDVDAGAYLPPHLLVCDAPDACAMVHDVEAFGPVATIMPYDNLEQLGQLVRRGKGSLVASVYSNDPQFCHDAMVQIAAFHGRLLFVNRNNAKSHTGHGSPLPHLTHGGPGRAGGGEEMGGLRGVKHYMQRSALQADPQIMSALTSTWIKGAEEKTDQSHPFRLHFDALEVGKSLHTKSRTITMEDIEHFAHFTGDTFYAHMNEEAAAANPFFPGRVAHGYLLLSFAAGLFVDPDPGPVLANYGLDNLRFVKPVSAGDAIKVRLTAKEKTQRNPAYGEVRWDVEIFNQEDEVVAQYELLTMNAVSEAKQ